MIDPKGSLIELCKHLEENLNFREVEPSHKVELTSGFKPNDYFLPHGCIGTFKTNPDYIGNTWFVEIWVDRKCIFRESHTVDKNDDIDSIEPMLMKRILNAVFGYSIMSSKQYIDECGYKPSTHPTTNQT